MLEPVKASQIPVEKKIFTDTWKLLKAYYNIEQTGNDEDWSQLIDLADGIYKSGEGKHSTQVLSKALALGVVNYLEALSKERYSEGDRPGRG